MYLGEIIRNYRMENGLTLKDFSQRAGLSIAYINQLERNRNPKTNSGIVPSYGTFVKVAGAMGISIDQLLHEVDENQPIGFVPSSSASDFPISRSEEALLSNYRQLNTEGQDALLNHSKMMVASGMYSKKSDSDELVEEEA